MGRADGGAPARRRPGRLRGRRPLRLRRPAGPLRAARVATSSASSRARSRARSGLGERRSSGSRSRSAPSRPGRCSPLALTSSSTFCSRSTTSSSGCGSGCPARRAVQRPRRPARRRHRLPPSHSPSAWARPRRRSRLARSALAAAAAQGTGGVPPAAGQAVGVHVPRAPPLRPRPRPCRHSPSPPPCRSPGWPARWPGRSPSPRRPALLLVLAPELLGAANLSCCVRSSAPTTPASSAAPAASSARSPRPVIGITGSYGKTTTKGCVAQVADLAGPTLLTPASFNSYLGVIRTINENLRPDHRTFVVEMGAYRRGDIAELCELVEPRIGILTAIGPRTWSASARSRRRRGRRASWAKRCRPTESSSPGPTTSAAARPPSAAPCPGASSRPEPHPEASAWAEDAAPRTTAAPTSSSAWGAGASAARHPVSARLLGQATTSPTCLPPRPSESSSGSRPSRSPARSVRSPPPEHRLSPIVNRAAGIVVIDDAYNANPAGAQAALEVLADPSRQAPGPGHPGHGRAGRPRGGRERTLRRRRRRRLRPRRPRRREAVGADRRGLEAAGFAPTRCARVADSGERRARCSPRPRAPAT